MEAGDGEEEEGGGGGARGFVPLRDDAVLCFKEHTGNTRSSGVRWICVVVA